MAERNQPPNNAQFIKIDKIKPGYDSNNIYAKVLELEVLQDDRDQSVSKGKCGDETGMIDFYIEGKYALVPKANKVMAIRNGISCVENKFLLLKIDEVGEVTLEPTVQIDTVNQENNRSACEYKTVLVKKSVDIQPNRQPHNFNPPQQQQKERVNQIQPQRYQPNNYPQQKQYYGGNRNYQAAYQPRDIYQPKKPQQEESKNNQRPAEEKPQEKFHRDDHHIDYYRQKQSKPHQKQRPQYIYVPKGSLQKEEGQPLYQQKVKVEEDQPLYQPKVKVEEKKATETQEKQPEKKQEEA